MHSEKSQSLQGPAASGPQLLVIPCSLHSLPLCTDVPQPEQAHSYLRVSVVTIPCADSVPPLDVYIAHSLPFLLVYAQEDPFHTFSDPFHT